MMQVQRALGHGLRRPVAYILVLIAVEILCYHFGAVVPRGVCDRACKICALMIHTFTVNIWAPYEIEKLHNLP
jgi:hypothetical protein